MINLRVLDLDKNQGRSCVEGSSKNDQFVRENMLEGTRATFRFEVTVSLEKLEDLCGNSFDEPIFVIPSIISPEKHCYRRQCYCIDDCMVTNEFTISVYSGVILR